MDEVDVLPIDLGEELGERVQARLDPSEVVLVQPLTRQGRKCLELHALRPIGDQLFSRPTRRGDPAANVVDLLVKAVDVERVDLGGCLRSRAHVSPFVGVILPRPKPDRIREIYGMDATSHPFSA